MDCLMLLSRVAERLYWAARYLERAEGTARIVREHSNVIVDLPLTISAHLGVTCSASPAVAQDFDERYDAGRRGVDRVVPRRRPVEPRQLYCSIAQARENLRTCRDILPAQAWNAVNDLYLAVGAAAPPMASSGAIGRGFSRGSSPSTSGCSASSPRR